MKVFSLICFLFSLIVFCGCKDQSEEIRNEFWTVFQYSIKNEKDVNLKVTSYLSPNFNFPENPKVDTFPKDMEKLLFELGNIGEHNKKTDDYFDSLRVEVLETGEFILFSTKVDTLAWIKKTERFMNEERISMVLNLK